MPTDPITVIEGGGIAIIEITITMPPMHVCAMMAAHDPQISYEGCLVIITTAVSITGSDLTCLNDNTRIPQVVIGVLGPEEHALVCGVYLTQENWFHVLRLSVKAKVDGVVDGDQTRELTVYGAAMVGSVELVQTTLTIIQVLSHFVLLYILPVLYWKLYLKHRQLAYMCAVKAPDLTDVDAKM